MINICPINLNLILFHGRMGAESGVKGFKGLNQEFLEIKNKRTVVINAEGVWVVQNTNQILTGITAAPKKIGVLQVLLVILINFGVEPNLTISAAT